MLAPHALPDLPDALDPPEARALRRELVARIAASGAVRSPRVLEAMRAVPRHLLVGEAGTDAAYGDHPVPIGRGQTISQPTVVGMMTEALALDGSERVLEIGTGSGYQSAILSLLAREVFTIERIPELGHLAASTLARLGHANVRCRIGDGYAGWPEEAPFDRILVTAAPPTVPEALIAQLAELGLLVAPIGDADWCAQRLICGRKIGGELHMHDLGAVSFVPMLPGPGGTDPWS